jgi:glycosyltransferase involved in cell wall biosynthesis
MPLTPDTTVSIVLPVYNGVDTVSRAIESIQAQRHRAWELIIVDDGSTDGSAEIAATLASVDERIVVLHGPHRGLVPALVDGCAATRGEFIARMDADDVSHPDRLARQLAWFSDHPEGGLCGTRVSMTGGHIGSGRRRYENWLNNNTTHDEIVRDLFVECPIAHPTFMMRRAAFEAVGGYRDFEGPEDYDLVMRFWQGEYTLGNVPETLLDWHEQPGRLSMTSPRYTEAAFRRFKRHWLVESRITGGRPLYQWGAGEVGKRWLREWPAGSLEAVADIRPSKVGQRIHGYDVIRPEDFPAPGACFIVVAVGPPGARDEIRAHANRLGFREGEEYCFIA